MQTLTLSDDAKALAGVRLGTLEPGDALRFRTPRRITERGMAALWELVRSGVVMQEAEGTGECLAFKPVMDCRPFLRWVFDNPSAGHFPLVEPDPEVMGRLAFTADGDLAGRRADIDEVSYAYWNKVRLDAMCRFNAEIAMLAADTGKVPGTRMPSLGSCDRMLSFLVMSVDADWWPAVGVNKAGNLTATWASDAGLLAAEFGPHVPWMLQLHSGDGGRGVSDIVDFADLANDILFRRLETAH